jgi:predicted aconitase with swiveling domain
MIVMQGKKIVRGTAKGKLILIPESFSFLGDVDMDTSQVIAPNYFKLNLFLSGSILAFTETKGSSGGCVVLMTLARKKKAPIGIITIKPPDYNLTEGAIMCGIPFISEIDEKFLALVQSGDWIEMEADKGHLILDNLG